MSKVGKSPKSALRRSIPEAYRARGHRINNLWLVYSAKTDRDWLLPSDRQLVHWLAFLEANPAVLTFDLAPEPVLSHDGAEQRSTELDAIAVYRDKHVEWHEVKAGTIRQESDHSQFLAQAAAASEAGAAYHIFNDEDLYPKARLAVRWLKALGFAAAIRGQEHVPCRSALVAYVHNREGGHVGSIISQMRNYDSAIVLGLLIRLSVLGIIHLDLEERSFGLQTRWRAYGG